MLKVKEKWNEKYPNSMERWEKNWDVISPIFKFTEDVRKVIYTTNAIESLNSSYRRLNRQRSVFPHPTALLKHCIYPPTKPQKMDYTAPELGQGIWRVIHHVWRQNAEMKQYQKKIAQPGL